LRMRGHYDSRVMSDTLRPRTILDITGAAYPGTWDAKSAYQSLGGYIAQFVTIPMPKKPVIALRAGGEKLFGTFPFFDAAFLGGSESLRTEDRQRWAGDASVYGSGELRYPIAIVPFLVPVDVGAIGFVETGKVYVDGDSPGGWHNGAGAGLWFGLVNPKTNLTVAVTNNSNRRLYTNLGFAF